MGKGKDRGCGTGETENLLHSAARSGDLNAVQSILSTNNPLSIIVNSRDKHSRTPNLVFGFCFFDTSNLDHRLHLAAWSGQAEVVSYLCKHKADVGAAAMDDMGAIHFAAQKGHLEVIRTLLSSGASINAFTRKGLTPLHYAVQGSHLELVKYLVKKGASLSAKTKAGKTPVDLANNEEILSFLEEYERSSKKRDLHGRQKAGESDSKPSMQEKEENTGDKAPSVVNDELENEKVEMKDDEDNRKEASSEPKKARIALNHLLTADDDLQDEENL